MEDLNSLELNNNSSYVPHFQPILNTANRAILGYEVLGRHFSSSKNEFISLGPFFHEMNSTYEEKVKIDNIIREKAIIYLKESGEQTKLFFNVMPNLLPLMLTEDKFDTDNFQLVELAEKYNINKKDIIVEITEDEYIGHTDKLIQIIEGFRRQGFKIALDDVGAGFSNLERIGYIHPDIIKIDIKLMRESVSRNSFKQVLVAISEMAEKLGSELLFEGIELEQELNLAFSMGASLLQGFYFSKAKAGFQNNEIYSENLKSSIEKFSGLRFLELLDECILFQDIITHLNSIFEKLNDIAIISSYAVFQKVLESSLESIPIMVEHILLTDLNGYQISPSYLRLNDGSWAMKFHEIGNNYAWKPYFIKHKAEAYFFKKSWGVTKKLFDITRQSKYVIFTYTLSDKIILVAKVIVP